MNFFALALFGTLGLAHDARTAADSVTKTYDLTAILPELHSSNCTEPLAPFLWPTQYDWNPELETSPTADTLAEVVLRLFDTEFSYDGRSIECVDGQLRVVAPPAVHKEIERVLAFLDSAFRRSIELRIDVVNRPLDAPVLGASISVKEADDVIAAAGNNARTHVLRVAPGRTAVLDATREVPLVADYDVEIAERSVQFDPVVYQLAVGTRIAARAAIVPGGVQLALVFRDGAQIGELRENRLQLGTMIVVDSGRTLSTEQVSLQSLSVLQRSLALDLALPDGRVAVIESKLAVLTGSSRLAILVRANVERREPFASLVVNTDRARLELLDASYVCPPRLELAGGLLQGTDIPRNLSMYFLIGGPDFSGEPSATATPVTGPLDWIEQQLAVDGTHQVVSLGPWIIAHTEKDGEQLAPSLFGPDSRVLAQARARENAALSLTLRRTGTNGAVLAQSSLPIVYGERSAAVFGGESLYVADADIEVATGAATIDPIVRDGFDGFVVSVRPTRASDGTILLDLTVRAHVLAREPQLVSVGAPLSLDCEHREFDDLVAEERLVFAPQGGSRRAVLSGGALALDVELR